MSKFNSSLVKKYKEEQEEELKQKQLRKKHNISDENERIVEKSNTVKFLIKVIIGTIKTMAAITVITLAFCGLISLIYPSLRKELIIVLQQTIEHLKELIGL